MGCAASMPPAHRLAILPKLCVVNVKLTTCWPPPTGFAMVLLLYSSPVLLQVPAGQTGGVEQFGQRAGRGGRLPRVSCEQDRHKGGLSQSPPFIVGTALQRERCSADLGPKVSGVSGTIFRFNFQTTYSDVIARLDRATQHSRDGSAHAIGLGVLDAPRSRGMTTAERASAFPRRGSRPGCWPNHPRKSRRAQGMPGAGCTHGLVCIKKHTSSKPQVHRKRPGIPCAMVYGLFRALPGDRALLPPSPARRGSVFANLAPASGRQNHTTSPSASDAARLASSKRPPHPALNVRDDAYAPPIEPGQGEGSH
jgi:hypothetical protein